MHALLSRSGELGQLLLQLGASTNYVDDVSAAAVACVWATAADQL